MPAAPTTDNVAITSRDRAAGRCARAAAIVIGANPMPVPCMTRPTIRSGSEFANPAITLPTNTMTNSPMIASRR